MNANAHLVIVIARYVTEETPIDRFSVSSDESVDDEAEFWQSFFERIQPAREASSMWPPLIVPGIMSSSQG